MRVIETRIERRGAEARFVGLIQPQGAQAEELFVSVAAEHADFLRDSADPLLCALLAPCMHTGEDLQIDPPVSPLLLSRLQRLQDILALWHPEFHRIEVRAHGAGGDNAQPPGVLTLFSGGVDSFYTLLRSLHPGKADVPRATHLLFVKGLEQPHSVLSGVQASIGQVEVIARQTGTQLLVASTNLRDRFTLNYERYYFGAAMAATVHALTAGIGTLLMPSSHSYAHMEPLGSHPLLDPLWSSERLDVIHHGAEARRVDKIAAILAEWTSALPLLRVCLKNSGGNFNCGRCRKCLRTMVALQMLGALGKAGSFPGELPADAAVLLRLERDSWLEELEDFGRERTPHSAVTALIGEVRRHCRRSQGLRLLMENTPLAAPLWRALDRWRQSRWRD